MNGTHEWVWTDVPLTILVAAKNTYIQKNLIKN